MAAIHRLRTAAPFLARCIGLSQSRSYGGAAAVQLQYDYDYYEEDDNERDRARRLGSPLTDAENSISRRGVQLVFIGSPGSKKHVYAQRLSKLLEIPHISMGSLVRQELNPGSSLYKQIANAVNQGKLVPEEIIFGLLSKRLEERYVRRETGFILDGIPRTRIQAEILDEIAHIDLVLNFKCTEDCLLKKHLGSGICSHCQEYFTIRNSSSASLDVSAQADSERMWKEKFQTYVEQSKPLEEYYRKQNKLLDFDVCGAPGGIWQGLLAALRLQDVNAIHSDHSSPKLTA